MSLPEAEVRRSAVDDLLDEYEQFLVKERGLKASTARGYYRSYAQKFLSHRFDSNSLDFSCLSASDITGFILHESETSSVGTCLAMLDKRLPDICNEGGHPHAQRLGRSFLRVGHLIGI